MWGRLKGSCRPGQEPWGAVTSARAKDGVRPGRGCRRAGLPHAGSLTGQAPGRGRAAGPRGTKQAAGCARSGSRGDTQVPRGRTSKNNKRPIFENLLQEIQVVPELAADPQPGLPESKMRSPSGVVGAPIACGGEPWCWAPGVGATASPNQTPASRLPGPRPLLHVRAAPCWAGRYPRPSPARSRASRCARGGWSTWPLLPDASRRSPGSNNLNCLQPLPNVPWGTEPPPLRTHGLKK